MRGRVGDGDVQLAQRHEIAALGPQQALLLDVRRPEERARGSIPDSRCNPLAQIRSLLNELPAPGKSSVPLAMI